MLKKSNKFLETSRLLLEEPKEENIDMTALLFADPMVMRYIRNGKTLECEEAYKTFLKNQKHWETFGFGNVDVFEKKSDEHIGRGCLVHPAYQHDYPDVEVGYLLHQKFWGKGFATEIARALLKWGFENLQLDTIIGVTCKENIVSQKILKKVGMRFRGEEIYPGTDFKSYFFSVDQDSAVC
ncbi:MAG: hypothetical protein K1000chlam3_00846 [Chlamydiae bacterium]|nr:hypothetical protein [Chlamydiota bacterium]